MCYLKRIREEKRREEKRRMNQILITDETQRSFEWVKRLAGNFLREDIQERMRKHTKKKRF
jgi:hypothetical protein